MHAMIGHQRACKRHNCGESDILTISLAPSPHPEVAVVNSSNPVVVNISGSKLEMVLSRSSSSSNSRSSR